VRLLLAAAIFAMATSGCFGSLAPFCEEHGAEGNWHQGAVYVALRNEVELAGAPVRHQGANRVMLAFEDEAFDEARHGDGWVIYVSWWSAGRRYMMRPVEEASTAPNGTTMQLVSLEVDRAALATYDANEADRFLAAATALGPAARQRVVDEWLNRTAEQYGRAKILQTSVVLDLATSYARLSPPDGFPPSIEVTEGPVAGGWGFGFDHARLSWTGTPTGLKMSLDAAADGQVSVYYRSVEHSPASKKAFQAQVRDDFAELGLPEPAFPDLAHHGPSQCAFG
jgi:hypothetical protein